MSVPGVGPITALHLHLTIEDPRRFARSEDVSAYALTHPDAVNQENAMSADIFQGGRSDVAWAHEGGQCRCLR
jgi:transposase